MTEAEILELLSEGTANVLGLVSIYFTVVSAYIAALYYFLHRAPFLMKCVALIMLSGAFLFLGFAAVGIERTLAGLFFALSAIPDEARAALPPDNAELLYFGAEAVLANAYEYAVWLGWGVAGLVYLTMVYLTFLHRWARREPVEGARS
ncbi:MAG: hypothetical protein ABL308_11970 [Oceanicaulis sp.]